MGTHYVDMYVGVAVVMRWVWQCGHDMWVWLVIILGRCDCGHDKLDKFIEGGILHVLATILVCSNDIPRAGIMDASHKDCNGYQ